MCPGSKYRTPRKREAARGLFPGRGGQTGVEVHIRGVSAAEGARIGADGRQGNAVSAPDRCAWRSCRRRRAGSR